VNASGRLNTCESNVIILLRGVQVSNTEERKFKTDQISDKKIKANAV
jgi:hypothetical protein